MVMTDRQALGLSIAAINDAVSARPRLETLPPSKEAQEARLAQTYQEALLELQAGNFVGARSLLGSILEDPLVLLSKFGQKSTSSSGGNAAGGESRECNPMPQLRFSTLKNLAHALYQQDSKYHEDALYSYLEAATIDQGDVVLWNRLGTLACSLGHVNIARCAFEQGLACSPGNWVCMEKLAEVLIAVGDEEACHYIVKCLLNILPSHPRATHIADVLEGRANARDILKKRENFDECAGKLNVLPRGLDLLEPQHSNLSFPRKRRLVEDKEANGTAKRRKVEPRLSDSSWNDLLISTLNQLQLIVGLRASPTSVLPVPDDMKSQESVMCNTPANTPLINQSATFLSNGESSVFREAIPEDGPASALHTPRGSASLEQNHALPQHLGAARDRDTLLRVMPMDIDEEAATGSAPAAGGGVLGSKNSKLQSNNNHCTSDAENQTKQQQQMVMREVAKDSLKGGPDAVAPVYEEELSIHDRRNFRVEKVRTRNSDKTEVFPDKQKEEKNQGESLEQRLEPFISGSSSVHGSIIPSGHGGPYLGTKSESVFNNAGEAADSRSHATLGILEVGTESNEEDLLQCFISGLKLNCGLYHIAHELLERLAVIDCKFSIPVTELLMLESMTRQFSWTRRSRQCSLFLAELCLDMFKTSTYGDTASQYLTECNFHLSRVVEHTVFHANITFLRDDNTASQPASVPVRPTGGNPIEGEEVGQSMRATSARPMTDREAIVEPLSDDIKLSYSLPKAQVNASSENKKGNGDEWSLWARYHWLNGRLHICCGRMEDAFQELMQCSDILDQRAKQTVTDKLPLSIILSHCKLESVITQARVQRKLYDLQIDKLLKHSVTEMVSQARYPELISLLVPALLPENELGQGKFGGDEPKRGDVDALPEYIGLSFLISACEKVSPPNLSVALRCHARKLELLCSVARRGPSNGGGDQIDSKGVDVFPSYPKLEQLKGNEAESKLAAEEVKSISKCAACLQETLLKSGDVVSGSVQPLLLGRIQHLLLKLMCQYVRIHNAGESNLARCGLDLQLDIISFVEAAIAFCRLQHLDGNATLEQQVSLLSIVHGVLAEHELCCGRGHEGGEGAFLKFAVKHLKAVELKLMFSTCESVVGSNLVNGSMEIGQTSEEEEENQSEEEKQSEENEIDYAGTETSSGGGVSKEKLYKSVKALKQRAVKKIGGRREDLDLDTVVDQCFFCLYGLNLRSGFEASSQSSHGLAEHKNTNCGDLETREQCAGVYHYVLPYAKACPRSRLLKLKKVFRAVHKQFPTPPPDMLADKAVDPFLDDPALDEESFREMVLSGNDLREVMDCALKAHRPCNGKILPHDLSGADMASDPHFEHPETSKREASQNGNGGTILQNTVSRIFSEISGWSRRSCSLSNLDVELGEPYLGVYENLYHFVSEVEDTSALEKWAGFVLTKEGEEFVNQNASLLKYDLCCNPTRFESWYKLAKIYDEEVELMLNDGSKRINVVEWRKDNNLIRRVEMCRQRTRRCFFVTLALSRAQEKQSEVHEQLALAYYESLQNVAPSYDQRSNVPLRDSSWISLCEKALKHFEGAFMHKPDWTHLFYMGKLYEKLGKPSEDAFDLYKRAVDMNSAAVDPIYRLHASRLKLLCKTDLHDVKTLRVIARHCNVSTIKESISVLLKRLEEESTPDPSADSDCPPSLDDELLMEIRSQLLTDCATVMKSCMEGELKHYHKARFRLAHGLYSSGEIQDMNRAKEELAFCFRSTRSLFTINMWEIDGSLRKIRRKAADHTNLDVQMVESSRKFITCVRKYLLLYLSMCEKTGDVATLERAFHSLRNDKKFSLCLDDISRLSLGKYIQALARSIWEADNDETTSHSAMFTLLERLFYLFMDHGAAWTEALQISLADADADGGPVTETLIYGYIHRYLNLLEIELKLDTVEAINERIRKRQKSFKAPCTKTSEICRHACLAWGKTLCYSLASITPLPLPLAGENSRVSSSSSTRVIVGSGDQPQLIVDVQEDVFRASSYKLRSNGDGVSDSTSSPTSPAEENGTAATSARRREVPSDPVASISNMKAIAVTQASVENLERASHLLRFTYVFFRDSVSWPFPDGINLSIVSPMTVEDRSSNNASGGGITPRAREAMDISVPRKLLLWAYTLVTGRTGSVIEAVRYTEEHARGNIF